MTLVELWAPPWPAWLSRTLATLFCVSTTRLQVSSSGMLQGKALATPELLQ